MLDPFCALMSTQSRIKNRSRMPLQAVSELSGDESTAPTPRRALGPKLKTRKSLLHLRRKAVVSRCGPNDSPKHLANLIRGRCGCKADCFLALRNHHHRMQEWLKLRDLLSKMEKLEKDDHVRVLLCFESINELYQLHVSCCLFFLPFSPMNHHEPN